MRVFIGFGLILLFICVASFRPSRYSYSLASKVSISGSDGTKRYAEKIAPSGRTFDLDERVFLKQMLSPRSSFDEKKLLLARLQSLRIISDDNPRGLSGEYASFLDKLLGVINSVKDNMWASRRLPIPLPSFRIRLGAARRLIESLLKEDGDEASFASADAQRKRRALAVLLSQLSKTSGGIRSLEKEAIRRSKRTSIEEMLERTPAELETPKYEVLYKKSFWEVRKYEQFAVCSTTMTTSPSPSASTSTSPGGPVAFNSLAGYIFGRNVAQEKMAMTTPVISSGDIAVGEANNIAGGSKQRKMSFVMPSRFWSPSSLGDAPKPMADSGVVLEQAGGGLIDETNSVAVLWFGGYATKEEVLRRTNQLLDAVALDNKWKVKEGKTPYLMQYNDPFQPPWARRNEVAIPVVEEA